MDQSKSLSEGAHTQRNPWFWPTTRGEEINARVKAKEQRRHESILTVRRYKIVFVQAKNVRKEKKSLAAYDIF